MNNRDKVVEYGDQPSEINERLMELTGLFEILRTLSSSLNLQSVLNNILLTPMGRMMISKGVVLLEKSPHEYTVEANKGIPRELQGKMIHIESFPDKPFFIHEITDEGYAWVDFFNKFGLHIAFPIYSSNKLLGLLVYGRKLSGAEFSTKEIDFLSSISNISATAIQNSLIFSELQEVNRRLDHSNQELNTLFDIGSELDSTLDVDKIVKVLGFALMGQLLVNKYAIYLYVNGSFVLKGSRGFKKLPEKCEQAQNYCFSSINEPVYTGKSGELDISDWINEHDIEILIPMKIQDTTQGVICLGEKINKLGYSKENLEFLVTLGNQAMISLENARLFAETLEKQRMEEELAVAREIQNQLLPKKLPDINELDIFALNVPSKHVGGDYYDIINLGDNITGVAIADVSGKGVPASLLMANLQASFRALAEVIENPARMTDAINNIIYKNTAADKFITYFYCKINRKNLEVEYCNAGHNPPILISRDKQVRYLDKGGLILGMIPDNEYEKGAVKLKKGDALVLYTDGITEALNESGNEFEEHRLLKICKENQQLSASEFSSKVTDAVKSFSGGHHQSDDITLVIVKVK